MRKSGSNPWYISNMNVTKRKMLWLYIVQFVSREKE